MSNRLPPFSGLRCFEAAARYESFAVAADVLHLTPSAVSHQIKALEAFLGLALFVRTPRGVHLTDDGRLYAQKIGVAFELIKRATEALASDPDVEILTLKVPPSLAHLWLVPRLADFIHLEQGLQIRLLTDPASDVRPDCEIRYGHGKWPNVRSEFLWAETLTPLATPALAQRVTAQHELEHYTLVHTLSRARGWQHLFEERLMSYQHVNKLPFDRTSLALEAARNGLGIALESPLLAQPLLDEGYLELLFPELTIQDEAYYFVMATGDIPERIRLFYAWLTEHIPVRG